MLRDHLAALAKVRTERASTRRGTREILGATDEVMVYKMSTTGDAVFVALNRSDSAQTAVNLPAGNYVDLITGATVSSPMLLPARAALVLAAQ
jgi:major membrane immunogen (membrane-anchored lipoprotein)